MREIEFKTKENKIQIKEAKKKKRKKEKYGIVTICNTPTGPSSVAHSMRINTHIVCPLHKLRRSPSPDCYFPFSHMKYN
jgi:hypothetical protein